MPATTANDNLHSNGRRSLIFLLDAVILVAIFLAGTLVSGFHLSFGNRLIKSVSNPQLNPANTLIRPIECRNANNHSEVGICMFSIDCMQNKGVPLSVCKHNYFVGTCCRLPDYNNFVGIVYDLRDTETNQLLEARKVTASTAAPSSFQPEDTTAEPPISSTGGRPERPDNSGLLIISASSSTTTSTTLSPIINSATSEQSTTASPADRYVISSTSLFPPSATTVVRPSGESARNSDGAASPLAALFAFSETNNNNHRQQIVPSELDSFQIQASQALYQQQQPNNGTDSAKKGTGYELIKDDPSLEVMTTINSAHSPLPTVSTSNQPQDSTSSLAIDELAKHPTSVVFANNHQVSLATLRPIPQQTVSQPVSSIGAVNSTPSVQQTTTTSTIVTTLIPSAVSTQGDQEFSLATSTSDKVSNTVVIVESTTSNQSSSSQTVGQNTSPFVDLVSSSQHLASSSSSSQTTTPFTTSLSTALLPNVSSHPYSPTPEPPTPLVSSISSISKVPIRIAVGTTPEFGPSNLPSLVNQTQPSYQYLYNQHSSSGRPVAMSNGHHSQPMLASKIVTGSSSTNNHLLPAGLSSLQSAILSHIPYKLASGLTSYLQAAMKPTVGGQRPLISSNTAPALQYQQQLTANQTSTQRLSSSTSSNSTTTTTISPASFNGAASQVRFPNLNESSTLILQPVTTGQPPTMSSISTSHDVVKEALQVCGRPQVSQTNMLSNHESRRRVARIVGGNQSLFGQWPWMVSLRQWRKGAFLHKCGAALLNENWAITAAHCVENVKPADLLLRLGEFDVSNQDEPYPYVERRVKQVVSHPSFDPKTFEYDLALLRFAETVKYERNIVPVCVPSGNDTYVDRMATVIGWGRLYEDGPLPDVIQHVDVPIITNNECEKMYKNAGYVEEIPDMFICAGISKGGRDSCEGDSGGPLTMVDHDGRSYLVGIISWGIGCALPSQPGVYTRITAFSGWINQITAF